MSIIIDDIDVSDCEYRTDTYKTLLADGAIKTFKNYCKICNDGCYAINCYYKQLQRSKKENKMLIEDLKSYQNWYDEQVQINDSLQKVYQEEHVDNLKYKQALEEIREIAKEPCIKGENCLTCKSNCMQKVILNKISEV